VVRYIPPEEYRHYPRYKWSRLVDKYAGVVVGALSMQPFQVLDTVTITVKLDYCRHSSVTYYGYN